jgi:hypothetical protein
MGRQIQALSFRRCRENQLFLLGNFHPFRLAR